LTTSAYYLAYARLMNYWRALLPGRFLDLDYESLVGDQEGTTRRLLEHCGLEWREACMHFHENPAPTATASAAQVRRPIYRESLDLWRNYRQSSRRLRDCWRTTGSRSSDCGSGRQSL
jgi:hypothetical protein